MPGPMRGGVVEEMRDMSKMFGRNAGSLGEIIRNLNSRIVSSDSIWKGPDAEQFRGEWQDAKSAFERMHKALQDASTAVNRAAERIERATGPSGR
jgi:WXG100 family type VII secretion target